MDSNSSLLDVESDFCFVSSVVWSEVNAANVAMNISLGDTLSFFPPLALLLLPRRSLAVSTRAAQHAALRTLRGSALVLCKSSSNCSKFDVTSSGEEVGMLYSTSEEDPPCKVSEPKPNDEPMLLMPEREVLVV